MSDDANLGKKSNQQLVSERENVAAQLWAVGGKRKELEAENIRLKREKHRPGLAAERDKVGNDLAGVRAEHKQLEDKYNQIEQERFLRRGKSYTPKRDVRHEFHFEEKRDSEGRLTEQRATMAEREEGGRYSLEKPDKVINWRRTQIGKAESRKAQREVAGGSGDDAGHLIGAQFGADPADKRNIARQNPVQNQRGTYAQAERHHRRAVKAGQISTIDVTAKYDPEKYGKRSYYRTIGEQPKVVFMNSKGRSTRAAESGATAAKINDARTEDNALASSVKLRLSQHDMAPPEHRVEPQSAPPSWRRGAGFGQEAPPRDLPTRPDPGPNRGRSK